MTDRPIIFSAAMVLALLDGRKAQTRRILKPQPEPFDALFSDAGRWWTGEAETGEVHQRLRVPFVEGDRLWRAEIGRTISRSRPMPQEDTMTADDMTAAARDVLAERRRQVEAEDFDASHDDCASNGQLAAAALGYIQSSLSNTGKPRFTMGALPSFWPWDAEWFKPTTPRRDLIKAGALILAEIERLDRAAARETDDDH